MSEGKQIDHRAEALANMERAGSAMVGSKNYETGTRRAQVHASLAIAEQLERLNEQLAEVIDPAAGTFPGVVRVRTEGTEG